MEFETTHKLPFEVAPWEHDSEFQRFRVGTVTGLWSYDKDNYHILAIDNSAPGNGHFEDVLQWFEFSCKRDKRNLQILEVWNDKLKAHLINKRGFVDIGEFNVQKTYYGNNNK